MVTIMATIMVTIMGAVMMVTMIDALMMTTLVAMIAQPLFFPRQRLTPAPLPSAWPCTQLQLALRTLEQTLKHNLQVATQDTTS